jgi:hypothetical protein
MNGDSLIFMVVLMIALAAAAGVLSWGLIRGVSSLSRHCHHRRAGHH